MGPEPRFVAGERFQDALAYAAVAHAHQARKGKDTPYIAHPLGVCALVLEAGGDEDQAIAALLHDTAEDQGGRDRLLDIENRFGPRVAGIVESMSDTLEQPKPPWRERKEAHLAHLERASADVLLVAVADKLHNAHSINNDLRADGEEHWSRFNGGKDGTIGYFRKLAALFTRRLPGPLTDEYLRAVDEMRMLTAG
ncbi:MAG: HD domain-containing protein [Acidimicrobiia bacterium]